MIEHVPDAPEIVTIPEIFPTEHDPVALNVTKPVPFPPEVLAVIPDC